MNPQVPPSTLGQTESHPPTSVTYYTIQGERQWLIVRILVKVPGGVRFLTEVLREPAPEPQALIQQCLDRGELSPRPYLLGQAIDESTADCVWALYEDCCRRSGLDPVDLLARTYPGWENREDWTEARWQRIRTSAHWQGTTFPVTWTPDCVLGLVMSLTGHFRSELATTLASTLAG